MAARALRIGDLAAASGLTRDALRYYERQGLLPKPSRSPAGYRLFSPDDVRRLRFIRRAQELGSSLREIKEMLALSIDPRGTGMDVRRRAEAKIADIEGKIESLRAMKKSLGRLTAACRGEGSAGDCPILESLHSERRKKL